MSNPLAIAATASLLVGPASLALAAFATLGCAAPRSAWRIAALATTLAAVGAAVAAAALIQAGPGAGTPVAALPLPRGVASALQVRLDALTVAMLALVTFIGGVILRFSRHYLDGDPAQRRYVRWLMATLAAVTLLVATNNLLVLAVAWIAASLALHRLLVLYPERAAAQLAARKKFIASRLADLALLAAVGLIGAEAGTLEIDAMLHGVQSAPLPQAMAVAAALLVVAAGLKSAQLPFHGWLIQVMEAPTPVSALLHAGIVNIAGFVLIRLAPLLAAAPAARTALVVWGTLTVAIAALVATTRVSIKVALAWSTCAQMGFMLLECGLGAYSIALLHLIGHSLYKAHAFLTAGNTPAQTRLRDETPRPGPVRAGRRLLAALASFAAIAALAVGLGAPLHGDPALVLLSGLLGVALASLAGTAQGMGWRGVMALGPGALALVATYVAGHALLGPVAGTASVAPTTPQLLVVALGLAATVLIHAALRSWPRSRFARTVQPLLFAGLYLDELSTRLTLRLSPLRSAAKPPRAARISYRDTRATPAEARS